MSELSEAINEMRNMRESYDQIGAAAEAYNTGKTELAANINAKGVEASATETLPELAQKVAQIAQETTIYDGADSYGKQIGADGSLWDLYQVLADMKTRFMGTGDYAALIVCEYYKDYDSLVLQGADGYYTCDGDYYDYASPTHVWHDEDNEKMNRWVAFLYRNEGARLDITNTSISPRSMYIGGHIGTIEYFVNGRLTDFPICVEDTDILDNLICDQYTQDLGKNIYIKAGIIDRIRFSNQVFANIDVNSITITGSDYLPIRGNVQYLNIKIRNRINFFNNVITNENYSLINLSIHGDFLRQSGNYGGSFISGGTIRSVLLYDFTSYNFHHAGILGGCPNLEDFLVGEFITNLPCSGWNPTNVLADIDRKAKLIDNIKNHILARVSDATGGTQLVFTVSTNMYNAIASEQIEWQGETMSLADAFLTKNWLLAGA